MRVSHVALEGSARSGGGRVKSVSAVQYVLSIQAANQHRQCGQKIVTRVGSRFSDDSARMFPIVTAALGFTLPATAPYIGAVSVRCSEVVRTAEPLAVLPAVPLAVPGIALGALALLGARRATKERETFLSMEWNEAAGEVGDDGCVLIGEETIDNGKAWFVCTSESDDPNVECESVSTFGNPRVSASSEDEYLCKAPKMA